MICRLCLDDAEHSVPIFDQDDSGDQPVPSNLAELIEKHLQLVLLPNDGVSKSLCTQCWQQLADFEQFCAMVMKKQLGLQQLKMEPFSEDEDADTKAQILCEPEIDVSPATADNEECNEIDGDASSNSRSSSTRTTSLGEMCLLSPIRRRMRLPRAVTAPKTQALKAKARSMPHKAEADEDEDGEGEGDPESRSSNSREMDSYIALHGRLECSICGGDDQFPNFAEMKRHFRNHHQSLGYVVCCQRRYKKRALYVDHLHMHNDPNYFRCKICSKQLVSRISYDVHMLRFHPNKDDLNFACDQCSKRFSKQFLLTIHSRVHQQERNEQCKHCDRSFRTAVDLRLHMRRTHDPAFVPFICDSCGAKFKTKQNLLVHKRTVHREGSQLPEVQCQECQVWLSDENSLRKHMYMHLDAASLRQWKCEQCGLEKGSRAKLAAHIRYHHPKEYHKCTHCAKEFKSSRSLEEHTATHTGQDLYECAFCERTFKNSGNMHKHRRQMHAAQVAALQQQKKVPPSKRKDKGDLLLDVLAAGGKDMNHVMGAGEMND
ncbi:transcription factor grauzone [Drosophila sechellia]|uniref:GM13094 n=1 Tax=Drosophila sechellia TaxID=7238 RepID=B4IK34_DROSE|nr:transcription factor grauzone [Drosophila sechellia]EDW51406.1 GM13094 [Drosophila sechellia]